jgi:hypothetical protein
LKPVQSEPQEQALPAANEPSIAGNSSPRPALADPNIAAASPPLSSGDAAAVVQNRSPATRDDQRLALITEGIASAQSKTATSSKPEVLGEELKASESAAAPAITTALAASAIDAGMAEKPSNSSSTSDLTVLTQHFDLLPSVSQQRSLAAANLRTKSARDAIGAAPPVLASFSLEQSGRQLRVIDQDGSVYVGNLQSGLGGGMAVSSQVSTPRAEPVAVGLLPAAVPSTGQTYLFRVDGTNLSLNQRVVFWGKLVDSTNTTSTDQHAVGAQLQQSYQLKSAATQLPQSPAVNRRLSGTAIVGSAAEIAVEAVSTSLQKR